jgi:hypothetical protein
MAGLGREHARADLRAVRLASDIRRRLMDSDTGASLSAAGRVAFDLRMRERWRDRARYCTGHLRPGVGDWAAVPLPQRLSFLHYVIRPFRLAGRYAWR